MTEIVIWLLCILAAGLISAVVLLIRRIWALIVSLECLCRNVDALRMQMHQQHGGH